MKKRFSKAQIIGFLGEAEADLPVNNSTLLPMKARAIRDLAQLSDTDFLHALSIGMQLVVRHVDRLWAGTCLLNDQKQFQAGRVLAKIAEEEATKFLILLDAVRCPKQRSDLLGAQLGRFNCHLAKGLYAKASMYRPGTLDELQSYVDLDRDSFYLDGPNHLDWIFRNEVIEGRESTFYVDYIHRDEGHQWTDPTQLGDVLGSAVKPSAVHAMNCLHGAGISTAGALVSIAELWRVKEIEPQTPCTEIFAWNRDTLALLDSRGQLNQQSNHNLRWIANDWQFPMYSLDLTMRKIERDTLRTRQQNWSRDW